MVVVKNKNICIVRRTLYFVDNLWYVCAKSGKIENAAAFRATEHKFREI